MITTTTVGRQQRRRYSWAEAFVTDARMRQKEQEARDREAGTLQAKRKAGKRKFHVEDHFDDRGTDLSIIGGEDMDMFVDLLNDARIHSSRRQLR